MRIWLLTVNKFITGLFCLVLSISSWAQVKPVVLILGDSLSAEYGLPRGTGWVTLLQEQLAKDKSPGAFLMPALAGRLAQVVLAAFLISWIRKSRE